MIHIEPLRPADWSAAMHQTTARVPAEQRPARLRHCLDLLEIGVLDPRGIWVARRDDGAIVGVQVCVPLPGSTCLFWLPSGEGPWIDLLILAALDWCRSIGCKLAQVLAPPTDFPFTQPFLRRGFRGITRMHQLRHDLTDLAPAAPSALRYESYRLALRPEFAAILERSYVGTLDCPELDGKRTIDEILIGHQGQGTFHPEFWWLAYDRATPIGLVLLTELPDGLTWELAYLGIVPEYRRLGLGRELSLHALHAVRALPTTSLLLAVDERNFPALQLYHSLGFAETECNEVLLYFFPRGN
jgi:mycothiol synthase